MNDRQGALSSRARLYQVEPRQLVSYKDPDSALWHERAFRHFQTELQFQVKNGGERFVEAWECYLIWGVKSSQTWHEGTSSIVHEGRSGAGYLCLTDRNLYIVTLGELTRHFIKRRGIMGRLFLAALRNIDMSRRELNDRTWTFTHGDIRGISSGEEGVTMQTVSETWQFIPYFSGDASIILTALDLARAGRIAELFRSPEPEPEPTAPQPLPSAQPDIFASIQQLGQLRDQGLITEEEFETKKAELLSDCKDLQLIQPQSLTGR